MAFKELEASLPKVPPPPTPEDFDNDFVVAMKMKVEHEQKRTEFNQKYHQMMQIKSQAQAQHTAAQEKAVQEEAAAAQAEGQKLIELKPELRDTEKRVEFKNKLLEGAKKHFGYTDSQLSKLSSAQDVLALSAAIEHAEMQANPPKPAKKTTTQTRKTPLAGSARRESKGEAAANEKTKSFAQVRKTGRSEDAATLIANLDL